MDAFVERDQARYNEFAASGADADYGKGAEYLWPIDTAPFYAFQICSGMLNTCGGIRINRDAQVTDDRGKVVKGLYAAGVCTSGWDGEVYGGGTCQTVGMWAGSRAARHAVVNRAGRHRGRRTGWATCAPNRRAPAQLAGPAMREPAAQAQRLLQTGTPPRPKTQAARRPQPRDPSGVEQSTEGREGMAPSARAKRPLRSFRTSKLQKSPETKCARKRQSICHCGRFQRMRQPPTWHRAPGAFFAALPVIALKCRVPVNRKPSLPTYTCQIS